MIYDFVAKIKDIKYNTAISTEILDEHILSKGKNMKKPLEIQIVIPDEQPCSHIYIKAEVSVSYMPRFHDGELEEAVKTFKEYLEELARFLDGEISKKDAFYNNSKSVSRIYP